MNQYSGRSKPVSIVSDSGHTLAIPRISYHIVNNLSIKDRDKIYEIVSEYLDGKEVIMSNHDDFERAFRPKEDSQTTKKNILEKLPKNLKSVFEQEIIITDLYVMLG